MPDGSLDYSLATPLFILRIFKRKLDLKNVTEEKQKAEIIETYLGEFCAYSHEFITPYKINNIEVPPLLCGLQEYVKGQDFDPWSKKDNPKILNLEKSIGFLDNIKRLIVLERLIPDLAGIKNIRIDERSGILKLVDMNNINPLVFTDNIYLDDRSYPIIDKSVEALSLIEKILTGDLDRSYLYPYFLNPERMKRVNQIDSEFHKNHCTPEEYLGAH